MKRIINLDFFRAVLIILALVEHAVYFINISIIDLNLKEFGNLFSNFYKNELIPIGFGNEFMIKYILTWISHTYIVLSCFNLGLKKHEEIQKNYFKNMKKYLIIFVLFVVESFIVNKNFGEFITIHPLMMWMIILMLLNTIIVFFKDIGVFLFYLLSYFIVFIINNFKLSLIFEKFIQTTIHNGFEFINM